MISNTNLVQAEINFPLFDVRKWHLQNEEVKWCYQCESVAGNKYSQESQARHVHLEGQWILEDPEKIKEGQWGGKNVIDTALLAARVFNNDLGNNGAHFRTEMRVLNYMDFS